MDEIPSVPYDQDKGFPCIESKVFGIGLEAHRRLGRVLHELCQYPPYHPARADNGHYHPTGLSLTRSVPCSVQRPAGAASPAPCAGTRPCEYCLTTKRAEMMKEVVRADALDRVFLATDYFDASINRISACGSQACIPCRKRFCAYNWSRAAEGKHFRIQNNFTEHGSAGKTQETAAFGAVWRYLTSRASRRITLRDQRYEADVLSKR